MLTYLFYRVFTVFMYRREKKMGRLFYFIQKKWAKTFLFFTTGGLIIIPYRALKFLWVRRCWFFPHLRLEHRARPCDLRTLQLILADISPSAAAWTNFNGFDTAGRYRPKGFNFFAGQKVASQFLCTFNPRPMLAAQKCFLKSQAICFFWCWTFHWIW